MSEANDRAMLEEHLAEILDGDAPQALYDLLAEDDALRDLRFDAARAAEVAKDAGADYVAPHDLESRLLAAIDARAQATQAPFAAPVAPTLTDSAEAAAVA